MGSGFVPHSLHATEWHGTVRMVILVTRCCTAGTVYWEVTMDSWSVSIAFDLKEIILCLYFFYSFIHILRVKDHAGSSNKPGPSYIYTHTHTQVCICVCLSVCTHTHVRLQQTAFTRYVFLCRKKTDIVTMLYNCLLVLWETTVKRYRYISYIFKWKMVEKKQTTEPRGVNLLRRDDHVHQ